MTPSRSQAREIWQAGVDAVLPDRLIAHLKDEAEHPLIQAARDADRILVVGGGKAGTGMAAALETALSDHLDRIDGWVNVPDESAGPLQRIRLHGARPTGSNLPTAAGVTGCEAMRDMLAGAGTNDIAICLISGGGSALMPAPVEGVTLEDKLTVTKFLHASGASIGEMNCVRKHLSRIKGGRLAQAFTGRRLFSLILSDVVGDPLDVIASGPTCPDTTTFADALDVIERYRLHDQIPSSVRAYLHDGRDGQHPETLKRPLDTVENWILGNNTTALRAAEAQARERGWPVLNLGSFVEGEASEVATVIAGLIRSIRRDGQPVTPPVCLLLGGETTVTLPPDAGKGGRNQELVLAIANRLPRHEWKGLCILGGGTDGEDGPTDAAGAILDAAGMNAAEKQDLSPEAFLARHDAYPFFDAIGCLVQVGLTGTNVTDILVALIGSPKIEDSGTEC